MTSLNPSLVLLDSMLMMSYYTEKLVMKLMPSAFKMIFLRVFRTLGKYMANKPSKCIHLTISRKQTYTEHYYQIYNQQIQQNKSARYLGVVIDEHFTWK